MAYVNRGAVLLCCLYHFEKTGRIAINAAADMHKNRYVMARGHCEDHISLGLVDCPRHVIEQKANAQATCIQLSLKHLFNLLTLLRRGGLRKGRPRHVNLARRGDCRQRLWINHLHTDPGVPYRGTKVRQRLIAQLLAKTCNRKTAGLQLKYRGHAIQ